MKSSLNLLKAVPIKGGNTPDKTRFETVNAQFVKSGFVFAPEVLAEYKGEDLKTLVKNVNDLYGKDGADLNKSFHKSFAKVRDASMDQLWFEQALHYLTTYGFEEMGFFSHDTVFIPAEDLDIPLITEGFKLTVIRGLTEDELKAELLTFLSSGVALKEATIKDVLEIATVVGVTETESQEVKNKEVRIALYDYFGFVPSQNIEFLRYTVYKITGMTQIIKNKATIDTIKDKFALTHEGMLVKYVDTYGEEELAKLFYRYKPIFLAFRKTTKAKKVVNAIRRSAVKNHVPMKSDFLNDLTGKIKHGEVINVKEFEAALADANTFRKARLAYALKYRTEDHEGILYRVRNGKSYATKLDSTTVLKKAGAEYNYGVVLDSIVEDIRPNVEGKTFVIPENLVYALPTTEKQFIGNIPSGSYVEVGEDMVMGVRWANVGRHRVDLDLSMSNMNGKIGWDGAHRGNDTQFSGDITDAPNGATEVFRIGNEAEGLWMVNLNFYNHEEDCKVPFKMFVGSDSEAINKDYLVDTNKIKLVVDSEFDGDHQKALGVVYADGKTRRFIFVETAFDNLRSSRHTDYAQYALDYIKAQYVGVIDLSQLIVKAGGTVVTEIPEPDKEVEYVDLSIEALDKTTIIDLLTKK
jgi:hypothetical protein